MCQSVLLLAAVCVLAQTAGAAELDSTSLDPTSEEALVRDTWALLDDPVLRPAHSAAPTPGSFGQLADPFLRKLAECRKRFIESPEDAEARRSSLECPSPAAVPVVWKAEILECGRAADGLLLSTRASTGKLPAPLTLFGQFSPLPQPYDFSAVQHGARIATMEMVQAIQSEDPERALALCAGGLALARDVSRSCLIGQMQASALLASFEPVCLQAIAQATPKQRTDFVGQLATIRSGWTPAAVTLDQERVFGDLAFYFHTLSSRTQSALPAEAHLKAVRALKTGPLDGFRLWLFGSAARRARARALASMAIASRGAAPAEVDEQVERLSEEQSWVVTLAEGSEGTGPTRFDRFLHRMRAAQTRLELLRAAALLRNAHDSRRVWPKTWEAAGMAPARDPRTGQEIGLEVLADGLALRPAADGDRTADDLAIELR